MSNVSRETLPEDSSSNVSDNASPEQPEPVFESAQDVLKRIFGNSSSGFGSELVGEKERLEKINKAKFRHPKKTRIIAVSNQKGGVGKTTSAVNLAAAFAEAGLRILVIDMDPQGNASTALGVSHGSDDITVYDVIEGQADMSEAVQKCPDLKKLDVIPSSIDLSGAELEIVDMENRTDLLKIQLKKYLNSCDKPYDYVIIDCAPSLGLLVLNALCAAHEVLIPIQAEYYALEGLGQLLHTIQLVQRSLNKGLIISSMLVTMFDKRTLLSKEVYDQIKEHYKDIVLNTTIPRSVRISEAPSFNQSVITYDKRGNGAIAYREAALEINKRSRNVLEMLDQKGIE
ncbi:cobyrinic acid a,c-diamide synthase [Scardovia inopinata]|mgnify:CR=1 FL=1|uniref:AAA domain-containing protein n=1 Tax=Scardovia inopinata F0304 TaxID=641146 RepID=W5IHK5_SCAIO|nr:AAA family ATPase [Scardovia inopinata]EFG26467.2 hypothetical protein HMPREF9020_00086 [Scardovia inopinata F0304]BAR07507.1 chromosome partitioning protein ParA [Scardovia inopinata JCM 12537]SUV51580.1 cobyrinic acid a,c-diamide synthase [Scardovia inopinata]